MRWTEEDLNEYKKTRGQKPLQTAKQSKYKNIKTKIDGHTFDSKKEANYYLELKLRLQQGYIKGYCLQPKFLLPGDIIYKADFVVFENDGKGRVIDVKGMETKEFIMKKKLFKERYPNLKLEVIK